MPGACVYTSDCCLTHCLRTQSRDTARPQRALQIVGALEGSERFTRGMDDVVVDKAPRWFCVIGRICVSWPRSVDAVHFLAPLRVGAVAIIAAMVNRTFASSMEVIT